MPQPHPSTQPWTLRTTNAPGTWGNQPVWWGEIGPVHGEAWDVLTERWSLRLDLTHRHRQTGPHRQTSISTLIHTYTTHGDTRRAHTHSPHTDFILPSVGTNTPRWAMGPQTQEMVPFTLEKVETWGRREAHQPRPLPDSQLLQRTVVWKYSLWIFKGRINKQPLTLYF